MQHFQPSRTTWHITFGTYGTRLHGGDRPTVSTDQNQRGQPFIEQDGARYNWNRNQMKADAVYLSEDHCRFIEETIPQLCERGNWTLRICSAAPDHVHVLLDIDPAIHGEQVRRLIKRWLTQELNELWKLDKCPRWWAREGSNIAVRSDLEYLNNAFEYIERQRTSEPPRPRKRSYADTFNVDCAEGPSSGLDETAREDAAARAVRENVTTHKPPIIGLIGGIGAGKSEVARILAEFGCLVVDSDDLARKALLEPDVKDEIHQSWSSGVFDEQNEVDRAALARIIFADDGQRSRLESIIHPRIEAARRTIFAAAPPETPAFVIDAPLLLEAGIDSECDHIIFVDTPVETRRQRVKETRGWNAADLVCREAAQIPLDVKRKRADTMVQNDGDLESLREQVRLIFQTIMHTNR